MALRSQFADTLYRLRAKIPLQAMDDAPPGYTSQEEVHGAARGPFKFASSQDSGSVPELECLVCANHETTAWLSANITQPLLQLSFVPPTTRGGTIGYTVLYRIADPDAPPFPADNGFIDGMPMSPPPQDDPLDLPPLYQANSAPLLSTVTPRVEVVLNRASRTRPIERMHEGQEFQWQPIAVAQGINDPASNADTENDEARQERSARSGHAEITGTLKVPKNEVTMFTCNSEIGHFLQARLYSQALKRPITVRCRVYLPSGN